MTVRIAQISDLHVSPEKPFFNANLERIFEDVRQAKPDLVLNTGDLGLYGERDNDDIALALDAHRELGIEYRVVPGNHDVGEHPDIPRRVHVVEESLSRYRQKVGEDFWVLDLPGWRLIGLNALIAGTDMSGNDAQLEMLSKAASGRAGRSLAVVLHKPIADLSYDDPGVNARFLTLAARRQFLDAVGAAPADLYICGHVHQYRDAIMGGSRHIWGPAASFIIGDPWQPSYGGKAVGYLEHLFHSDGSHEHRLQTVRDLVHHDLAVMPEVYGDVTRHGPGNG